MQQLDDTIVAIATPAGEGAIAVIRLSGPQAIGIADGLFSGSLAEAAHGSLHYGFIRKDTEVLDEVVLSIFRSPKSFTTEDVVEISCHGSPWIQQELLQLCLRNGARMAEAGEFSFRAFLHGRIDLSQAEAVADLVSARNRQSAKNAMNQLRGGFSDEVRQLRDRLIEFAALIELENDFGEEDVEFADRSQLEKLVTEISAQVKRLAESFRYGNALKEGAPVAIVGAPNAGKSTLLNALLNEEKAIVSDIAGTTRDVIEDRMVIEGIEFRFIDTAGLRDTTDQIESIGIRKAMEQLEKAHVVLLVTEIREAHDEIVEAFKRLPLGVHQQAIILLNKIDDFHACHAYDVEEAVSTLTNRTPCLAISAKSGNHLDKLRKLLVDTVRAGIDTEQNIVSNARHYEALRRSAESLETVDANLRNGTPGDLLALDIRHAMRQLGEITGDIDIDKDVLGAIFGKFCIGK